MSSGKGRGGGGAHDYYGTIAGLVCAGPVDELVALIVDGKTVWPDASRGYWDEGVSYDSGDSVLASGRAWIAVSGHTSDDSNAPGIGAEWEEVVLRRSDVGVGNPAVVQVVEYGTMILYWGTADQVLDAELEPTFAAEHPPYRHQCFVILKDFLFGRERVSAPNVEVVVRRHPQQAVVTGAAAQLDQEGQANPLAAAADLLCDPVHGLGLPLTSFDLAGWSVAAAALADESDQTYISLTLTSATPVRGAIGDLVEYYDGWLRFGTNGRIQSGVFPRSPSELSFPSIDVHSLVDEVSFSAQGHSETINEVTVRFTDRLRAFKPNAQRAVAGDRDFPREESLQRGWIMRADQAAGYAAEYVHMMADPGMQGTITVIEAKSAGILPGGLFWLHHAGDSVLCRCERIAIAAPPADRVTITFRSERGLHPKATQVAATGPQMVAPPAPEVITLHRIVQPPQDLAQANDYRLVVLAARKSSATTSLRVHMQQADADLFYDLGMQATWAVTGELTQEYTDAGPDDDDSEALRIDLDPDTPQADRMKIFATQSADAISDDTILVWAFTGDGNYEIMTLKAIRLEGDYRLKVMRGRLGTPKRSFATGDRVWIMPRLDTVTYSHGAFASLSQTTATATFRLQPRNIWRESDVSDPAQCPDIDYTFNNLYPPASEFDYDFGVVE